MIKQSVLALTVALCMGFATGAEAQKGGGGGSTGGGGSSNGSSGSDPASAARNADAVFSYFGSNVRQAASNPYKEPPPLATLPPPSRGVRPPVEGLPPGPPPARGLPPGAGQPPGNSGDGFAAAGLQDRADSCFSELMRINGVLQRVRVCPDRSRLR